MKDASIVIAGYYGFGNAGDELILRALVSELKEQTPQSRITVLSQNPEQTRRHFQVEAVHRWKPWQWIPSLWRARRFILGGGGLLQETTGSGNHVYYLSLVVLAKCFGCRADVVAIGVDPVRRFFNRWWTGWVLQHWADSVSVRDADSHRALESTGVFRRIQRVPDPVFRLPLGAPGLRRREERRLALCVSPWARRPGWEHDLALLASRIVSELGVQVDFISVFPAQDNAICYKAVQLATQPVTMRAWAEPESLLSWIHDYDMVLSMRYHALVLAAMARKPFIGWSLHRKVRILCNDFHQPVWTFERGWDAEAVFRQFAEAWRHRAVIPTRYDERRHELELPTPGLPSAPRPLTTQSAQVSL